MLRDVLKGEWGFDGVVMSDWFAARSTVPAGRAGLDLVMPGPERAVGRRAGRARCATAASPRRRSTRRSRACCGWPARVGALDEQPRRAGAAPGPRPRWPPSCARPRRRASCSRATRVAAAAGRRRAAPRRRARPQRRRGADARRRQRDRLPALHRLPAGGAARGAGRRRRGRARAAACAANTRVPRRPARAAGRRPGVEVRFLAADGTRAGRRAAHGGAFAWHGRLRSTACRPSAWPRSRSHARLRAAEAGEHRIGCSGVGRFAPRARRRRGVRRASSRSPPGADLAEAHMRPPQQRGTRRRSPRARSVEVALRHEPGGRARFDVRRDLPAQRRAAAPAATTRSSSAPSRWPPRPTWRWWSWARPRRSRARASTATRSPCPAARTSSSPGAEANPRTVVVVNAGAPVLLPWADEVAAVLLAWFPGQEFGDALADVLLGAAEPGGRLPTTWPAADDGLPSTRPADGVLDYERGAVRRLPRRRPRRPRAAFRSATASATPTGSTSSASTVSGDGRVAGARAQHRRAAAGARWSSSTRRGRDSAVERPPRWLVGFAAVDADAGEEVTVEIAVPARTLAHWDEGGRAFVVEPGDYELAAGRSSRDLRCSAALTVAA